MIKCSIFVAAKVGAPSILTTEALKKKFCDFLILMPYYMWLHAPTGSVYIV